jgi:structural maintenance of chromosome 2
VTKHLLNGHKVPQQTIQNLFQSVQLNINNPNFVIMQGKITKVRRDLLVPSAVISNVIRY